MGSSWRRRSVWDAVWISCVRERGDDYEDGDGERGQLSVVRVASEFCVREGERRHRGGRAWRWRWAGSGGARRRG